MLFFQPEMMYEELDMLLMLVMYRNSKKMLPSSHKDLIIKYTAVINACEEEKKAKELLFFYTPSICILPSQCPSTELSSICLLDL